MHYFIYYCLYRSESSSKIIFLIVPETHTKKVKIIRYKDMFINCIEDHVPLFILHKNI